MAVEYIDYKGEKLPIKLGYYTLKMMQQEHNANLQQIEANFALYEPLLFYSLQQGHKVVGKEFKYGMDDMVDILDDCFFQFVELIPKFFPVEELGKKMERTAGATRKRR